MNGSSRRELRELAKLYGIQRSFVNTSGRRVAASDETVLALLPELGAPVAGRADVADALAARREQLGRRLVEPVLVLLDGEPARVDVASRDVSAALRLELENGDVHEWRTTLAGGRLELPLHPPHGYHRLAVEAGRERAAATLFVAPPRAYQPPGEPRDFGVFAPLYALHRPDDWGAGDLALLRELLDIAGRQGARFVATLPLLAAFPGEPSPYSPASRRFWNEQYAELGPAPAAAAALREGPFVDHDAVRALKHVALARLSDDAVPAGEALPELDAYARFRAAGERHGLDWRAWPARMRDGELRPGDVDGAAERLHRRGQAVMDAELAELAAAQRAQGRALYFDLPLGVHPRGFDVWRAPALYPEGASAGAPPDDFAREGQDWGFPPPRPEAARAQGHRDFVLAVRHHARHAGVLRLDHAMSLQRLWWVPRALGSAHGVYVRYPARELLAVLCLESHRHRCRIVGENLGTVAPTLTRALERHGMLGMYVGVFSVHEGGRPPVDVPRRAQAASLDTHDTPTFAGWWAAAGAGTRRALLDWLGLRAEADPEDVHEAWLEALGRSDAELVIAGLEDLWLEPEPQNVPGTSGDVPNWRRRARYGVADVERHGRALQRLARSRAAGRGAT